MKGTVANLKSIFASAAELVIRGNAGRHIPPAFYSAFCPCAEDNAECSPHITLLRDFMRKRTCAKMRIA